MLAGGLPLDALNAAAPPQLAGTYLQLAGEMTGWDAARFREEFDYFATLKLKEIVVQWSATRDQRFFPAVQTILAEAKRTKMKVWLGLYHDPDWWNQLTSPQYLNHVVDRSEALHAELVPLTKGMPLQGWYIPQEIDDLNWNTSARRRHLVEFLARHRRFAGKLAVSAFSNGTQPAPVYARGWRDLITASGVNTLLFQDGIGVRKLNLDTLPPYVTELRKHLGKKLRVVVELFEQTSVDPAPFAARPAPAGRVQQQLQIAGPTKSIGFSVPEYLPRSR